MRRRDREITDPEKIEQIISACHCCRLGFNDNGQVYIVPLNFGYTGEDGRYVFYFHGAQEGRKIDLIRTSPYVGFEMDTNYLLREAETACGHSARFQSVIGNGTAELVENMEEKKKGLRAIMRHTTGTGDWEFQEPMLRSVCVMKVTAETLSCKEHE